MKKRDIKKRNKTSEIYPLVENNVLEKDVLKWAINQHNFNYMIDKMRETEKIRELELGRPFAVMQANPKYNADYVENIVKTKWLKKLNEKELENKKRYILYRKTIF